MQPWCARFVGLLLGACVATSSSAQSGPASPTDYVPLNQIQIVKRFAVVEVNAANLAVEAHRCVPPLSAGSKNVNDTAHKLPLPRGQVITLSHLSSANSFVISGSKAICIQQSSARYPIFTVGAFSETVNPSGVPPTITDDWYVQIARRLAEAGRASVVYIFPNGNADVTDYWVEDPTRNVIHYAVEFKKAGNWEKGTYDLRFTHASLSSVSSTKRGTQMEKINLIDSP
jgi:hypothetical protein